MPSMIDSNAQEIVFVDELHGSSNYEQLDAEIAAEPKPDKILQGDSININQTIEALFRAYANEDFEDGMESDFVSEITSSIQKHGTKSVEAIKRIILEQNVKPQVAFEALRWLGRITHPASYRPRLLFLESCLDSPSRWVRDGAALGLASMKDTHAIPGLREAIAQEKIQDLRKDLEAVLLRLENLSHATISVDDK